MENHWKLGTFRVKTKDPSCEDSPFIGRYLYWLEDFWGPKFVEYEKLGQAQYSCDVKWCLDHASMVEGSSSNMVTWRAWITMKLCLLIVGRRVYRMRQLRSMCFRTVPDLLMLPIQCQWMNITGTADYFREICLYNGRIVNEPRFQTLLELRGIGFVNY